MQSYFSTQFSYLFVFSFLAFSACESAKKNPIAEEGPYTDPYTEMNTAGASIEAGSNAGSEAGNAGSEAGNAGSEAGNAGSEAGSEAGSNAGSNAGSEAGSEILPSLYVTEALNTTVTWWIEQENILKAMPLTESTWLIANTQRLMTWSFTQDRTPIRFDYAPQNPWPQQTLYWHTLNENQSHLALIYAEGLWLQNPDDVMSSFTPWQASPLNLNLSNIQSMAMLQDRLWLYDAQGLAYWEDERLSRVNLGLDIQHAQLSLSTWDHSIEEETEETEETEGAEGHHTSSTTALWIYDQTQYKSYALVEQNLWSHSSWQSDQSTYNDGQWMWGVWQGQLRGGVIGEPWTAIELPFTVDRMWGGETQSSTDLHKLIEQAPTQKYLWILSGQNLWRYQASHMSSDGIAQLAFVPLVGQWRGAFINPQGRFFMWGEQGLAEVQWSRSARWLYTDTQINSDGTSFTLSFDDANAAEEVSWALYAVDANDDPQGDAVQGDAVLQGDFSNESWILTLDNLEVSAGRYLLKASILYQDQEVLDPQVIVDILPAVTWSQDILPIFEANCSMCHNEQGGARDLSTANAWEESIESILFVTRMQSMPIGLPPLNEAEIRFIDLWKLGIFQF